MAQPDPLIPALIKLCDSKDRGPQAKLRRYWSPVTRWKAYEIIFQLPIHIHREKYRVPDSILCALYPEHLLHTADRTFAQALGQMADGEKSFDAHFRRLLAFEATELEDLGLSLNRMVKRLAKDSIGFDYNHLLWDLRTWPEKADVIKIRWAMDFWQAPDEGKTETASLSTEKNS